MQLRCDKDNYIESHLICVVYKCNTYIHRKKLYRSSGLLVMLLQACMHINTRIHTWSHMDSRMLAHTRTWIRLSALLSFTCLSYLYIYIYMYNYIVVYTLLCLHHCQHLDISVFLNLLSLLISYLFIFV